LSLYFLNVNLKKRFIMLATVVKSDSKGVLLKFEFEVLIPKGKGMLEMEEIIQSQVHKAGLFSTEHALWEFDTDGSSIEVDGKKYTSKGKVSKAYQTPYGEITVPRHVYQSNQGGNTYCPLDNDARIIVGSTPKLAKMVSSKYSESGARDVHRDLYENHGRYLSRSYIRDISHSVGSLVEEKKTWNYATEIPSDSVSTVGVSVDGTCMLLCEDGYRQAMVGSISLYDALGERLYTRYTAFPPEYGKESFHQGFDHEIKRIRKLYPDALYVGVADGAADNRTFLESRVDEQILDFFHACEYLSKASKAAFRGTLDAKAWYDKTRQILKKEEEGAALVLKELECLLTKRMKESRREDIVKSITYFGNHQHQMDYYRYRKKKWPIGSGVIEAACKVIIKQRMCNSGMKWTDNGARPVLALRCFNKSNGMWEQFWNKVNRYGK
jgi:hypothetical protein